MNDPGKAGPDTLFGLGDPKQNRGRECDYTGTVQKVYGNFSEIVLILSNRECIINAYHEGTGALLQTANGLSAQAAGITIFLKRKRLHARWLS